MDTVKMMDPEPNLWEKIKTPNIQKPTKTHNLIFFNSTAFLTTFKRGG